MKNLLRNVFNQRSLLGTLLLITLIGEPTVGLSTGFFTPNGMIVFFFLYLTLFHLFDSIITKYNLVIYQVVLLTFAIYSVLVTGLLNKELTEYVLKPQNFLIITLIRIQASFFVVFTFYLLNKIIPRDKAKVLSIKQSIIFFAIFVLLFSLTGLWGIPSVIFALKTAPMIVLGFSLAAILALFIAFKTHPQVTNYQSKKLTWVIYFYILLGAIPNIITFMILLITMILGGIYLLLNKTSRNSLL